MGETTDRTGMKQVELTDEDRHERAMKAAAEQVQLDALHEKKASHNREWNQQILQREKLISQLSTEADTGLAWVPAQTDMFGEAQNDSGDEEANGEDEEVPRAAQRKRGRGRRGAAAGAVA